VAASSPPAVTDGPSAPFRVAVVGGGIAGLVVAHRLLALSRERGQPLGLTLFEASMRLGGNIRTERLDGGQVVARGSASFLVKAGPDGFVTEKPWALTLVEQLGLGSRVVSPDRHHSGTYVVHEQRLHPTWIGSPPSRRGSRGSLASRLWGLPTAA
jgi:oxygen-dependent protoporphyrinogen oxidase